MRHRILVIAAALVGFAGAGTLIARGARQWSIANFVGPVMVNRTLVSGQVLIVHDDEKMARGEPCTTFYRFEPGVGPKEALVSFHCKPRRADKVSNTTLITAPTDIGIKRLVEYQLGGDSEAHGVPR